MSCFAGLLDRIIREHQNQYDKVCVEDCLAGNYSWEKAPIPENFKYITERIEAINEHIAKHCKANGEVAALLGGADRNVGFVQALEIEKTYLEKLALSDRFIQARIQHSQQKKKDKDKAD